MRSNAPIQRARTLTGELGFGNLCKHAVAPAALLRAATYFSSRLHAHDPRLSPTISAVLAPLPSTTSFLNCRCLNSHVSPKLLLCKCMADGLPAQPPVLLQAVVCSFSCACAHWLKQAVLLQ